MVTNAAPSIYPTLRYADAQGAIAFLVDAFGFGRQEVMETPDGAVQHGLLSWGNGLIMVSSKSGTGEPGLFDLGPMCLYLVTEDPDAVHDRAVAAGAEIVMGLVDQDYGSREFAARDAEGFVWCFGTYQPAVTTAAAPA